MSSVPSTPQEHILANTKHIHVIGPKPVKKRSGILRSLAFYAVTTGIGLSAFNNIPVVQHTASGLVALGSGVKSTITRDTGVPIMSPFHEATPSRLPLGWIERDPDGKQKTSFDRVIDETDPFDFNDALIEMLKAQKMEPKDALILVTHYQISNTVSVLGGESASLRERETQRQQQSFEWVQKAYALLAYSDPEHPEHDKWTELMEEANTDSQVTLNLRLYQENKGEAPWTAVHFQLMQSLNTDVPHLTQKHSLKDVADDAEKLTFAEAQQRLQDSVEQSGLASLRLPTYMTDSKTSMVQVAHMLDSVNAELQHITGLEGQLLGLNKRVVLDLDTYMSTASTYFTEDDDYIHIKSYWDKLDHEWFHAFDYSMQESVRALPFIKPASQNALSRVNNPQYGEWTGMGDRFGLADAQHRLWEALENPKLTAQERTLLSQQIKEHNQAHGIKNINNFYDRGNMKATQDIPEEGSPWMHWRNQASRAKSFSSVESFVFGSTMSRYLKSETEALAFSFGSYAQKQFAEENTTRVVHFAEKEQADYVGFEVFGVEADKQKLAWKVFFQSIEPWWAHDQQNRIHRFGNPPKPLSIEQLHQKREHKEAPTPTSVARAPNPS